MRRSNSSPSVALFPFLAVLVCAMGALILLLLVTTRKMRQVAVARALAEEAAAADAEKPPEPPAELPAQPEPVKPVERASPVAGPQLTAAEPTADELEQKAAERRAVRVARDARQRLNEEARQRQSERELEWKRTLAELKAKRDEQRDKLRESTSLLTDLQGRLQRTEVNLERLKERKLQLDSKKAQDAQERAKMDRQHLELADLITETQKEMAALRKAHADEASRFAFIPYDGASGTTRRPIYLECTAAGVRFQPEGILLDEADLKGFTESHNPLLAGTQAVIELWQANPSRDETTRRTQRPYVLLLVRPTGTISYYVARKMLSQIGEDFGYELIEDDFALQLPPTDPKTKTAIQTAIAEALRHRGESLAEGTRVGAPRLNQVMMGRSEDPIEFGSLDGQVAAATAQKESPFSKNSTRRGKNFSITRSPVKSEELLPDSFRSELDRHAKEKEATFESQANSIAANGSGRAAVGQGSSAASGGTGSRAGTKGGIPIGGSAGARSTFSVGQSGGSNGNGSGDGSGVEIQRGQVRRDISGNSSGGGGNSNSAPGRIPQLPKLTDPFSRETIAQGGPDNGPPAGEDPTLGYSGGVNRTGAPGMGRVTGRNGGVPGGGTADGVSTGAAGGTEMADAGDGAGSTDGAGSDDAATGTRGRAGTRTGSGTRGRAAARGKTGAQAGVPAIAGARSGTVFDLQPVNQASDQQGGASSGMPEDVASGDLPAGGSAQGATGTEIAGAAGSAAPDSPASLQGSGLKNSAGGLNPIPVPNLASASGQPVDLSASGTSSTSGNSSGQAPTTGQRQAADSSSQGGSRPSGGTGRKSSGEKNAFDKTQGAVVANQFTTEAKQQLAANSGSGGQGDGSQKSRKSHGDNPQDPDEPLQRNKPKKPVLTPAQKQEAGRQRWGGNNVGQIGFEKKIQVQVMADKFIIGKNEVEIEIEPGTSREELVEAMLEGLDANSETWGSPPKKFYWVPYLQFEVYKGGVIQYEQVHAPLREWGLFSDAKFREGLPGDHGLIQPVSKTEAATKKIPPQAPATKKKGLLNNARKGTAVTTPGSVQK
jgi:hypothetical protein